MRLHSSSRARVRATFLFLVTGIIAAGTAGPLAAATLTDYGNPQMRVAMHERAGHLSSLYVHVVPVTPMEQKGRIVLTLPAGYDISRVRRARINTDFVNARPEGNSIVITQPGSAPFPDVMSVGVPDVVNPLTASSGRIRVDLQTSEGLTMDTGTTRILKVLPSAIPGSLTLAASPTIASPSRPYAGLAWRISSLGKVEGMGPYENYYHWERLKGGQWSRINGAVGMTYRSSAEDVGSQLRVVVTSYSQSGFVQARTQETARVIRPAVPKNKVKPNLEDPFYPTEGSGLTKFSDGEWDSIVPITSYVTQWQRCTDFLFCAEDDWDNIPGATGKTYYIAKGDTRVRVAVSACNAGGCSKPKGSRYANEWP